MYENDKPAIDQMKKTVDALNAFHTQTHALDLNHQDQVRNLHNAIQSLFADPQGFSGSAANTLQNVVSDYLKSEHAFTGNNYGDTSPRLASATTYSEAAAKNIQSDLHEFDTAELNYNNKLLDMVGLNPVVQEARIIESNVFGGPDANMTMADVQAYANGECVYPPETERLLQKMQWEQWQWDRDMGNLATDPLPQLPPVPTDPAHYTADPGSILHPTNNNAPVNLTDAQKRLLQNVKSRLGNPPFDEREIVALIAAGYLDPDAIAAMIRNSSYTVFGNSSTVNLMNELSHADQLKFIQIVQQYQSNHPDLTSDQVTNYLQYTKMKAQGQLLYNDLTSTDPNSIAQRYPTDTQHMLARFNKDFWGPLNRISDPFTLPNRQVDGGHKYLVGFWGEWASGKISDAQGRLVHLGRELRDSNDTLKGEVDLIEKGSNGGSTRWVEVKNGSVKSNWGTAVEQVQKYIAFGATEVVIQLPQPGKPGYPLPSAQQVDILDKVRKANPTVKFEIVVAESDPNDKNSLKALNYLKTKYPAISIDQIPSASSIPYEPPAGNWGNRIP